VRQRQPRQKDPRYLSWLRRQRCACGCLQGPPCDAAHLRASSAKYDKPNAGVGQKPDDKWALPLRHAHHMAMHDYGDEVGWLAMHGIKDPFATCQMYYQEFQREAKRLGVFP
jgi:hypothetical protein